MGHFPSHINNARLKDNPFQVAMAVDVVLKLFDGLEVTVRHWEAADKRVERAALFFGWRFGQPLCFKSS